MLNNPLIVGSGIAMILALAISQVGRLSGLDHATLLGLLSFIVLELACIFMLLLSEILDQIRSLRGNSDSSAGRGQIYRVLFLGEDAQVQGRYDYECEDDAGAVGVAATVLGAIKDRAVSFELWCGNRAVMARSSLQREYDALQDRLQDHVQRLEETIRDSTWAVASSKELLARLDAQASR